MTKDTQQMLAWVVERLKDGFTGKLVVHVNGGSIRHVEQVSVWQARDVRLDEQSGRG